MQSQKFSELLQAALTGYPDNDILEIDNHLCERAAAMYSLIGTAKLNGLDPEGYLRLVLERIADHPINQVDQLLPWNIIPALPIETRLAA